MIFIGSFLGEPVAASADGIILTTANRKMEILTQLLLIKTNVRITNSLLMFLTPKVLSFQRGVVNLNLFIDC